MKHLDGLVNVHLAINGTLLQRKCQEKKKILNSETLFPFVGENDAEQLKELMKAYKGYIMKKSREMRFWRPLQTIWAFIKGFIGVSVGV